MAVDPPVAELGAGLPALRIRLLGRARIDCRVPARARPLKYRKGLALLAYLALPAGRWHRRDELAALLWPALDASAARTNLRQVVTDLRRAVNVAPDCAPLRIDGDLIGLDTEAAVWLDVAVLERAGAGGEDGEAGEALASALDVLLAGLEFPESPAFDGWLQGMRRHLAEQGGALLERASRRRRETGDLGGAIALARRLLAWQPLDEGYAHWLMTLLLENGERRAVLACHDAFAARLRQELGTLPGVALARLRAEAEGEGGRPLPARFSEWRWLTLLYCLPEPSPGRGDGDRAGAFAMEGWRAVIAQWGGSLQPQLGRGVLAVFGLGADSERSVARALHAAIEVLGRCGTARLGVSTGRVLVQAGEAAPALLGEAPDLAMQLGWMARPGELLAPEAVVLQAGEAFAFDAQGRRECAAAGGALALFRLRAPQMPVATGEAPAAPVAAFVGRDALLDELFGLWRAACAGDARVALVQGAAGLGKTCLTAELARRVAASGGQVRRLACRLESQHQPLAPVLGVLAEAANADADAAQRREHVRRHLEDEFAALPEASRGIVLDLFGAPGQTAPAAKDAVFGAVIEMFGAWLGKAPLLLVVDDLHWCDHTTLELLGLFMRGLDGQRVLLLLASRPGAAPACPAERTRHFELAPMARDEALALVAAHDDADAIAPAERRRIAEASGGVPLFIERLVRSRLEGGHHRRTIDELLQAELARLGSARQALGAAAVLGERFSLTQLKALLPETDLRAALGVALRQRLVTRAGGETYAFAHALIRDAAYAGLPEAQACALHRAAARVLAEQGGAAQAVARQFAQARQWTEAAAWWRRAGEQAMAAEFAADAQYGFAEALACLQRQGGQGREGNELIALRMCLGSAAQLAEGFGSALAYEQFTAALNALEAAPADTPAHRHQLFAALSGRYMGGGGRSQGVFEGLDIAWRLEALAETPQEALMADFALGNSLFWRGQLRAARDWQERGVVLARQIAPPARARFSVDDPAITCRAFLGWTLWFLGDERGACRVAAEGVAQARAGRRMHALCFALTFAAGVHWCREDETAVRRLSSEAQALARQHGFPLWESVNTLFLAWVAARERRLADTAALFDAAAAMQTAYDSGVTTARWIAIHALLAHGDAWAQALPLLDATIAEAESNETRYCLSDLLWQKAECLRRQGDLAEARRYRRRARALARKQQALGLLARFDALAVRGGVGAVARRQAAGS